MVIRRSRAGIAALGVAVAAVSLAACSSGTGAGAASAGGGGTQAATIRMVQEWPVADAFWIPWIVARDKGYYQAAGINLQIIPPPEHLRDGAVHRHRPCGRGLRHLDGRGVRRAQGAPMVSIAAYGHSNNWGLISATGKPLDFADVKGKTIGTYNDSSVRGELQIMLHSEGLTLSDVRLITASSDTVPLLLQHKVDAITGVTNAEGSELASEGMPGYSIALARDHGVPNSPVWVLAANSDWLAKNRPLAQKFMTATLKGWQYAISHPVEAVADFERDYPKAETLAFATQQWKDTIALFGPTVTALSLRQSNATWSALLQAASKYQVVDKVEAPGAYYTNELLGQP